MDIFRGGLKKQVEHIITGAVYLILGSIVGGFIANMFGGGSLDFWQLVQNAKLGSVVGFAAFAWILAPGNFLSELLKNKINL